MDSSAKQRSQKKPAPAPALDQYGAYNAGYGYAGYGYGFGNAGEGTAHRTLQDYMLILRERMWYIIAVFLLVFSAVVVFTFTRVKQYQAHASVQILRNDPLVMQVKAVTDNEVRSAEDLNTQVKVLESETIIQKVADKLKGADLEAFKAPYLSDAPWDNTTLTQLLKRHRKVIPQRISLVIDITYDHPNPEVAAKVADLFVDEFMDNNSRIKVDESLRAVEDLKLKAEEQRKKVDDLARGLQAYREKNNMVSLDQRKDIVTESLKALSLNLTTSTAKKNEAEVKWKQVNERLQAHQTLLDLPFISGQQVGVSSGTLVSQLSQQLAAQKIAVAQMRERYREKHPKMVEALNSLKQTELELQTAVAAAASSIKSEYELAVRNEQDARHQLAAREAESLEIDRYAVEYTNMEREFKISEQLLQNILTRMRETQATSTIQSQNVRIVDRSRIPIAPFSPNIPINVGLGLLGGIGLGLAFGFFIAYIDDRVKSSYDIETVLGLPILGIIPEIRKMEQPDRAQIVLSNEDRQISESFLSLHSSLRLKDASKTAKVFLTTSTIPGEGKSFTTTNLALTFAAHGEKVIIVDCDLRKPNIHKSFRRENGKGVIDVVYGTSTMDEVILKAVHPNLDVLTSGGRAKNPTQILNDKNFEAMLVELRKRYDRVFIDTPPLAAVSDALIVLPLCDGSLFTILFNKVRRKAADFAAQKLRETNVPNFGVVLNGLNLAVSGYYYAQYYDKTYKDYYVVASKNDDTPER